jgi:hypothetical protein
MGIPPFWKETEIHPLVDDNDLEDLEWCGTVDRTAVSLRTPVSARFKGFPEDLGLPSQAIDRSPVELKTNQQERILPQLEITATTQDLKKLPMRKKVTFQPTPEELESQTRLSQIIQAPPYPVQNVEPYFHIPLDEGVPYGLFPSLRARKVIDEGTQTTAADFRVALIRTPLQVDFEAIHNNESGHHGLDFSYRKLLKRCGSKWANEQ